jgi:hypothetical protein
MQLYMIILAFVYGSLPIIFYVRCSCCLWSALSHYFDSTSLKNCPEGGVVVTWYNADLLCQVAMYAFLL